MNDVGERAAATARGAECDICQGRCVLIGTRKRAVILGLSSLLVQLDHSTKALGDFIVIWALLVLDVSLLFVRKLEAMKEQRDEVGENDEHSC